MRTLPLQVYMPHQWLEGNLPVSAKCVVCDKNCGSVRRLQDWRCLWCKAIVSDSDTMVVLSRGANHPRLGSRELFKSPQTDFSFRKS